MSNGVRLSYTSFAMFLVASFLYAFGEHSGGYWALLVAILFQLYAIYEKMQD